MYKLISAFHKLTHLSFTHGDEQVK